MSGVLTRVVLADKFVEGVSYQAASTYKGSHNYLLLEAFRAPSFLASPAVLDN